MGTRALVNKVTIIGAEVDRPSATNPFAGAENPAGALYIAADTGNVYETAGSAWNLLFSLQNRAVQTKSNTYTMLATDGTVIVTGASKTITLPDATTVAGKTFTVKNGNITGTTVATVAGTIDGAATDTSLSTAYLFHSYRSDGANYFIVA